MGRLSIGLRLLTLLMAGAFTLTYGSTEAVAAGSGSMVAVQEGTDVAALPGARVFGDTPASTPETVSFVLREQNLPQLEASVQQGVEHFLSVDQFARTYGQSPAHIAELRGYLAKFGISTDVYRDNVDVVAHGTAGEFDNALAVKEYQYHVPAVHGPDGARTLPAQDVHGVAHSPKLPGSIARYVLAILGLTNYAPFASQVAHVNPRLVHSVAGSSDSCVALTGLPSDCHTPADFANNYGLSKLYQRGATGQGQTLAIVTLAALDPGAPQYFWKNVLNLSPSRREVTVQNIDGGPGAPSFLAGSDETDLDVEQSGAVAPAANVIVYQAPNTDPGFADSFFAAASQNTASTVSTSWGESEAYIAASIANGVASPGFVAAFDEAFLEMAAQGQSGFAVSGDAGAYDASLDLGTTNLSVDFPGDSPYITAAGGTTLPFTATFTGPTGISSTVTVPAQRIWGGDYLWHAAATILQEPLATVAQSNVVGSGGGFSTIEPGPAYQHGVPGTGSFSAVPYLTPTDYQNVGGIVEPTTWKFNANPPVISGLGSGRAVPDVSTDADPYSGYLIYSPVYAQLGVSPLEGFGGTSVVAPQLNGSTAVINSSLGKRVGLWNPSIYSFATGPSSPFTPLDQSGTSNDNLFYTGTPGLPYNEGSGLGYPNLSKLASAFASQH